MALGYGLGAIKWIGDPEKRFISRFVVNVALPFNCMVGLLNNLTHDDLVRAGGMIAAAMLSVLLSLGLGAAAAAALKLPRNRWAVFTSMVGTSNTMFIGFPLTTQLFGEACIPYLMIYYLASAILSQSLVVMLIERSGTVTPRGLSLKGLVKDLVTKPPIIGMAVGILLLVLNLHLPALLMDFAEYVGGTVTPLALVYCGSILYGVGLKNLRFLRGMPLMLVLRLIAAPLICLGMCYLFGITGLARNVFIVESALPVATQITVLAGAYGADEEYSAVASCWSILGCFITIPVLMLLLG